MSLERYAVRIASHSDADLLACLRSFDLRLGFIAARHLRALASMHEARLLDHARAQGMSWDMIAWTIGLTRQAAHQRWSRHRRAPRPPLDDPGPLPYRGIDRLTAFVVRVWTPDRGEEPRGVAMHVPSKRQGPWIGIEQLSSFLRTGGRLR